MGLNKRGESSQTYCRILLKDNLGFQVGKKEGDERKNEMYDVVSGNFLKIEEGSYKGSEGEERELVRITLHDEEIGEIIISTAWTSVARNIVNSLAGAKELGFIEIGLYQKEGKDGRLYPNAWIKNDKERPDWLLSIEEQKKYVEETTFKGKTMRDYGKLESYLKSLYDDINKKAKFNKLPDEIKNDDLFEAPKKKLVVDDSDMPF